MPLIPLLPIFHQFNREFFDKSLTFGSHPKVAVRWSDGRLKKTAGLYRSYRSLTKFLKAEIVLSRPLLESLPSTAIESTLCHEMIHAWIDLVLNVKEGHGANFQQRMHEINSAQNRFQVTVHHQFPVPVALPKWWAVCLSCGVRLPYRRLVNGAACRQCCEKFSDGQWDSRFLLKYEPVLKDI